ncbi:MAG: type II toxin-antitoxin system ParD family antitoxin [Bryobacteraceae bacterium]
MKVELKPEDELLVQRSLEVGKFSSAEDVVHHALQSLAAEEHWFQANQETISAHIDLGIAQLDRGEGMTPEESLAWLETQKDEWRAHR